MPLCPLQAISRRKQRPTKNPEEPVALCLRCLPSSGTSPPLPLVAEPTTAHKGT